VDVRHSNVDPYLTYCFAAEIDGLSVADFSEVTGLDVETTVETIREGGVNSYQHQLPGATSYPTKLVLKRGLADSDKLWSWYQDVVSGIIQRRDISVLLLDMGTQEERWRWNIAAACPIKWKLSAMDVRSQLSGLMLGWR
jgi:phage tail-like protein